MSAKASRCSMPAGRFTDCSSKKKTRHPGRPGMAGFLVISAARQTRRRPRAYFFARATICVGLTKRSAMISQISVVIM
jgi:hypothetical protein